MNYKNLEQLLPDELEKIIKFINSLFDNKINDRLTNQEYQKNNMEIKCPFCNSFNFKKNGHKMVLKDIIAKIVISTFQLQQIPF